MAEAVRPTKKQRELLSFIERFINEHGYSPSYREIMSGLNYTSVATVALHVNNLIKRGHLRKRDHSARSLEVITSTETPKTEDAAKDGEQWLLDKVETLFKEAESADSVDQSRVDQLFVLTGALRILGLGSAVETFTSRLEALQQKLPAKE